MYNGNNIYQQMGYSENPYASTVRFAADQVRQQQYQQPQYQQPPYQPQQPAYPQYGGGYQQPPQYQPNPAYQQNYQFITNEGNIVKIRQAIFNVLKEHAQQDDIQTQFVARYANNNEAMESLVEDCCWNVFSYINPAPQNASVDQIIDTAVRTTILMHLVQWLFEANQYPEYYRAKELTRINPEAANKYTQLNQGGTLSQIAQKTRALKSQVTQLGMTYRGPQANAMVNTGYGQPQQPVYNTYGGAYPQPQYQPNPAVMRGMAPTMPGYGTQPRPTVVQQQAPSYMDSKECAFNRLYDVGDDDPVDDKPAPAATRREAPQTRIYSTHPEGDIGGINDIFAAAEQFAEQYEEPEWHVKAGQQKPVQPEPAQVKPEPVRTARSATVTKTVNPIDATEDAKRYGRVVQHEEFMQMRLKAKDFAPNSRWPTLYDFRHFARRARIDENGILHETIVDITSLTEEEVEYIELESDPTARRMAEQEMAKLDRIAQAEVVRVSLNKPVQREPIVVGEQREMKLFTVTDAIAASSVEDAETKASVAIIQQTNTDVNQNDALAFLATVNSYLGTYTDKELDAIHEFLDALSIDKGRSDDIKAYRQIMQQYRDVIPLRIWHFLNDSMTKDVNKLIKRIVPKNFSETTISSFVDDIGELSGWLIHDLKMDQKFIEDEFANCYYTWVNMLKCLYCNRDGEGQWNIRLSMAELYNMHDYLKAAHEKSAANRERHLVAMSEYRAELEKDGSLDADEIERRLADAAVEDMRVNPDIVTDEDSNDAYWFNHSVFAMRPHVVVRVPTNAKILKLNQSGYTHASAATNPSIARMLDQVFKTFETKVKGLQSVTVILSDDTRLKAVRTVNGITASEYLLEREEQ